jgi:aldehyde dehydrogenase (NAD+)
MIKENERRFQEAMAKDFKPLAGIHLRDPSVGGRVQLKEWMKPVEAPVPRFLAKTGHKGMIYRAPCGVTLIIGPFNGPLLLLIRSALAAGNTCASQERGYEGLN